MGAEARPKDSVLSALYRHAPTVPLWGPVGTSHAAVDREGG